MRLPSFPSYHGPTPPLVSSPVSTKELVWGQSNRFRALYICPERIDCKPYFGLVGSTVHIDCQFPPRIFWLTLPTRSLHPPLSSPPTCSRLQSPGPPGASSKTTEVETSDPVLNCMCKGFHISVTILFDLTIRLRRAQKRGPRRRSSKRGDVALAPRQSPQSSAGIGPTDSRIKASALAKSD